MKIKTNPPLLAIAISLTLLSGCTSTEEKKNDFINYGEQNINDGTNYAEQNINDGINYSEQGINDANAITTGYYNFDDDNLSGESFNGETSNGQSFNNGAINRQSFNESGLITEGEIPTYTPLNSGSLETQFSDSSNPLSQGTIYFMYDSSQIRQEFISVIAAHGEYLLTHPNKRILLEGHADERGSREYNIALGEQRAKSVYQLLKRQGVSDRQVGVISYGEEKPAKSGLNNTSWQLNRRVEITY